MNNQLFLDLLCDRYPSLAGLKGPIGTAAGAITDCYTMGGKVLVCGNGGSSSDADHLVAELMKSFEVERPLPEELKKRLAKADDVGGKYLAETLEGGLPAISLSAHSRTCNSCRK